MIGQSLINLFYLLHLHSFFKKFYHDAHTQHVVGIAAGIIFAFGRVEPGQRPLGEVTDPQIIDPNTLELIYV